MLPSVAAKLGSEPAHGLSAREWLWTWARAAGEPLAPFTSWLNLQVTRLQYGRVAAGWRETSGCQTSTVTSPFFLPSLWMLGHLQPGEKTQVLSVVLKIRNVSLSTHAASSSLHGGKIG